MSPRRRPAAIALVVWTFLVWTARINNIWADDALSDSDKWGRTLLALGFTLMALTVSVALWRRAAWLSGALLLLSGWTVGVWLTRSVGIATGDHSAGFIAVHLVLAAVSIVLSALALREGARSGRSAAEPAAI